MISRKSGRKPSSGNQNVLRHDAPAPVSHDAQHLQHLAVPGWSEPLPTRVEWIRDRIEHVVFTRVEVVNKWRKARAKAEDAAKDVSADTALGAAYDAGRIACEAVLACHHVRIRSGHGHHERVFSAVAAFEIAGCKDIVADSEEVRIARHQSEYGSELATSAEVQHARAWVERYLPLLQTEISRLDPDIDPYLE